MTVADIGQASKDTQRCAKQESEPLAVRRCIAGALDQIAAYAADAITGAKAVASAAHLEPGACRDYLLDERELTQFRSFSRTAKAVARTLRDESASPARLEAATSKLEIAFRRFERVGRRRPGGRAGEGLRARVGSVPYVRPEPPLPPARASRPGASTTRPSSWTSSRCPRSGRGRRSCGWSSSPSTRPIGCGSGRRRPTFRRSRIGEVMRAGGIGRVVASRHPGYAGGRARPGAARVAGPRRALRRRAGVRDARGAGRLVERLPRECSA